MNAEYKSIDNKNKHRYLIFLSITFTVLLFFIILSISSTASSSESIVDSINIGDPLDEADHNLFGFGPIEPAAHGGNWGGADDGNLRAVWYNDSFNPSDISTDSPDENYASLVLNSQNNYIANKIEIRALDGIANDSFEIYIGNVLVYSYDDIESSETWKTHQIDISSFEISGQIQLKIVSTGTKWSNFDTYGQLSISWIKLYALEARQVTVRLVDSCNNPISKGIVRYHKNGWKEFGTTDKNGNTTKLIPKASYTFRMKYLDATISKRQDIRNNPVVVFSTVPVTVRFENSSGVEISGGNVSYHSGGWKFFGITDSDGEATKELLPGTYTFRLRYDGASISKRQDVSMDPNVIFSTINVTIKLQTSDGSSLSGGVMYYHSSSWKYIGITDQNGFTCKELLSRKYTFKVNYDGASNSLRQDVGSNPSVVFSTVPVTVRFENSSGVAVFGGNVSYHSGGWKFFGFTDNSGETIKELLPRKYTFRLSYDGVSISKRQDISSDPLVVFSTIKVTVKLQNSKGIFMSGGNVSYHSSGWKYLGVTNNSGSVSGEFLPRKFSFRMKYLDAAISKRKDVSKDPLVVFSTIEVKVKFQNSSGILLSGGNVSFHSGGWKFFGITDSDGEATKELLPRKYTFRLRYDGSSISKRQDVKSNPSVVFSTIQVTVLLVDEYGTPLSDGNLSYHSSGWKVFGITDSNGQAKKELLPRKYTFKAVYNNSRYIKRQNVGEDSFVIIKTDIIDNYPPVSDANGPYLAYVDEIITFNASKSYDSDGTISNYTWNFGDGNIGYGILIEHIYSDVGDYIVNITVTDNNGLVDHNLTYSRITEKEKPSVSNGKTHSGSNNYVPPNLIPNEVDGEESIDSDETEDEEVLDEPSQEKINNPPVAKASLNKEESGENCIIFDASESFDPDGDVLFYRWDFDNDGSWDTSYSNEPKVRYQFKDTSFEGKAVVQVFDGKNTDKILVSYSIEKNVQNFGKANSQKSADKSYYLFIEWWVFFVPILLFFILSIYIYKKRSNIIKKLGLVNIMSKKKQRKICKIITSIFEYF